MADKPAAQSSSSEYRGGYKYQLATACSVETQIRPRSAIETTHIKLSVDGVLSIGAGYAWDGASGPVIDCPGVMRASLVHDALYQLMRRGHLKQSRWRSESDRLFSEICREDGVGRLRSWLYRVGLKWFGGHAASKDGRKKVHRLGRTPEKPQT